MMKKKLAIIGAATFGDLIAHHAVTDAGYSIAGYYDDFSTKTEFNGNPILGKCDRILEDYRQKVFDSLIIGIGYTHMPARVKYYEMFKGVIPFANVIHSSSYIDPSCKLGEGIYIFPGNILDSHVEIGDNVIIANASTISHHSKIMNHTIVSAAVSIAGMVTVNECCFIGIGATIIDCITVGKGSVVGAGSVVIKNTEADSVSVGVPAKAIKYKK